VTSSLLRHQKHQQTNVTRFFYLGSLPWLRQWYWKHCYKNTFSINNLSVQGEWWWSWEMMQTYSSGNFDPQFFEVPSNTSKDK